MEDLAATLMPYPHSAPLYLLYDAASIANASHGLAAPPPLPLLGDDDDGFEFATMTALNGGGVRGRAVPRGRAAPAEPAAAAAAARLLRGARLCRDVAHGQRQLQEQQEA
jgi:hypothetical protein